jgi:hypothetical protein
VDSRAASCRVISEGNAATVQSQRGAACDKMRLPVTGAESEKSHKQALFLIESIFMPLMKEVGAPAVLY